MKLTVGERLVALSVLPEKGNYATLKIVDDLKRKLAFQNDGEMKKLGVKLLENGAVQWDAKKDGEGKELSFGDFEKQLVKDSLKSLDEKKELEPRHMSLYDKFVN